MTADEVKKQFQAALDHFVEETKKLRTGRANASMLDSVTVEVYGQNTPLSHIATIGVLDAQMLQVSPYDPSNLGAIRDAIAEDESLGLNPADDGRVVRVPIPAMTTERRTEVVKLLNEKAEEARISFRNSRHERLNFIKENTNSQDERTREEKELSDQIDEFQTKLDEVLSQKEQEIMTV